MSVPLSLCLSLTLSLSLSLKSINKKEKRFLKIKKKKHGYATDKLAAEPSTFITLLGGETVTGNSIFHGRWCVIPQTTK